MWQCIDLPIAILQVPKSKFCFFAPCVQSKRTFESSDESSDYVLLEDSSEDSDVCHRQALHFLAKAEYSAALGLVERARMAYLDTRETGDLDTTFINIVSTQAVCLLKLGDYVTSKKFAEQVCIQMWIEWSMVSDQKIDSNLPGSHENTLQWCSIGQSRGGI